MYGAIHRISKYILYVCLFLYILVRQVHFAWFIEQHGLLLLLLNIPIGIHVEKHTIITNTFSAFVLVLYSAFDMLMQFLIKWMLCQKLQKVLTYSMPIQKNLCKETNSSHLLLISFKHDYCIMCFVEFVKFSNSPKIKSLLHTRKGTLQRHKFIWLVLRTYKRKWIQGQHIDVLMIIERNMLFIDVLHALRLEEKISKFLQSNNLTSRSIIYNL